MCQVIYSLVFEALGVVAANDLQSEVEQLREEARSWF